MRRNVNSSFTQDGIKYVVVESKDCIDCAFRDTTCHVCKKHDGGDCAPGHRGDGKSVKFLKSN